MKKFVFITCMVFMAIGMVAAKGQVAPAEEGTPFEYERIRGKFYQDGVQVDNRQALDILKDAEICAPQMRQAGVHQILAVSFMGAGLGFMIPATISGSIGLMNDNIGASIAAAGLYIGSAAMFTVSIPFNIRWGKKVEEAVTVYNDGL